MHDRSACDLRFILSVRGDFRVVNMFVPPKQIADTVELWSLPDQRKISLRFLAACLLDANIQGETHDSIEDARTALLLYQRYLEIEKADRISEVLHRIYEYGRMVDWKYSPSNPFRIDG